MLIMTCNLTLYVYNLFSTDLKNPKTNKKTAGFSAEEKEGFTNLLNEGFIDSFRVLYPWARDAFSFWTYMGGAREKNVGWYVLTFIIYIKKIVENYT